ncbi:putative tellurium resistance membrane protein TerC [Litorivivens lipolytica]|uniref:Putative tellurium resistance membrane protein TerC n=1 Tax=Litorivivens lipolytica TaxID=1524264 RepID=A0A7W4Z712_9GAMM|nr:TerC family protein [Litorivivens lipolytica]MBB3048797.1 putative tellurium resistance membrane protein TerC [Litorivivens lipolytica]
MEWIGSPEAWVALSTLIALEIVLGIDNIIFISILVARLPVHQRDKARRIGIGLAMLSRLALLFALTWVMGLTKELFTVFGEGFSGRDMILIGGGLFLLLKSTHEIHNSFEIDHEESGANPAAATFGSVLFQICLLDIVFSLDSVITAVGMVDHISIMVIAVVVSVLVMLLASKSIADFVDANPTIKMLALAFLILIGVTLIVEGFDVHVPKGYIYFAMAFSVTVELLNIRLRKSKQAIRLQKKIG